MHSILDITNEATVAYDFADATTTAADIRLAKRLLRKVYKHLSAYTTGVRPSTVSFFTRTGRNCRIIVHDVDNLMCPKDLFMVAFYGHDRGTLSPELSEDYAETDWKILTSMINSNDMLCYASQQLTTGNWFNIVLFKEEARKLLVTSKGAHHHAAYTLAPKRFKWVRIQNAKLPDGIANYTNVVPLRTRYYEFDNYWFAVRQY